MRKVFYSLTFAFVLLLASLTSLASFDEPATPTGNGTVPENALWLPVVKMAAPCGVSEGTYGIYTNRYGDQWHQVAYYLSTAHAQPEKISIATDTSFGTMILEGGKFGGIIPDPYSRFRILIGLEQLNPGQVYYARMEYLCGGISAQTPVLIFTAMDPFAP